MNARKCFLLILAPITLLLILGITPDIPHEALLAQAENYVKRQQFADAEVIYERITKEDETNGFAWARLGYVRHSQKDYDGAMIAHRRATAFPLVAPDAYYNIACIHSIRNQKDQAFTALNQAARAGFVDLEGLQEDPDLKPLRDDPRFQQIHGFRIHQLSVGQHQLAFALLPPLHYQQGEPIRVLIGLGPGSESLQAQIWGLSQFWGRAASERGWLVVAPERPPAGWHNAQSLPYLDALLAYVREHYQVVDDQFHLAGCSNGGASAFTLALARSNDFSGLTVAPGVPKGRKVEQELVKLKDMKVQLFVGENDCGWSKGAKVTCQQLKQLGVSVELHIEPGEGHVIESLFGDGLMRHIDRLYQEPI